MKCSELIEILQENIKRHGDLDVEYASGMESGARRLSCDIFDVIPYDDKGLTSDEPTYVYIL